MCDHLGRPPLEHTNDRAILRCLDETWMSVSQFRIRLRVSESRLFKCAFSFSLNVGARRHANGRPQQKPIVGSSQVSVFCLSGTATERNAAGLFTFGLGASTTKLSNSILGLDLITGSFGALSKGAYHGGFSIAPPSSACAINCPISCPLKATSSPSSFL